ncbi:acetyl-CoA C-acyltransferase [Corynebacterium gerontici]|uniref:Probable acetyl-CoA acetyltransferase n=2 Tax=Corynebacterium gerontici TaxID=2079234 RepID=A0A3G6J626_9CORY|nr:acetyl-CoA C-acyltransferase [Corynebacterium gerontici]AZA11464.1 Beta-ketothiolase BktB [Corynebacterium gerontici]
MEQDLYILSGARTAIGSFGGQLSSLGPKELGAHVASAALERAGVGAEAVDSLIAGIVLPNEPKDLYVSRRIAKTVGMADHSTAMNVNRLCGSGVQAIVSSALDILSGGAQMSLAVGTESMSNAPYSIPGLRSGRKMSDGTTQDWMLGALSCPFGTGHMGVTAENVAREHGISREDQDAFAAESQRRALRAIEQGLFEDEIAALKLQSRKGDVVVERDEHPRQITEEKLATLKPVFEKDGTVTAGNASGINDGAAAVLLASAEAVQKYGVKPLAKIKGWGIAGVPPHLMGLGPIPAVPKALKAAGVSLGEIGVIESNEAFASQAIAVSRELEFDPAIVNPNGGAIALGHPVGATGVILTVKALHHMHRNNLDYGLVTMCIGGGQGIALVLEKA